MSKYIGGYSPTASSLVYQYIENASSQTTTSGTFSNLTGVSLTVLQTGTYRVDSMVNLSINASGIDNRAETQVFVNGTGLPITLQQSGTRLSGVSLASLGWHMSANMTSVVNLSAGDVIEVRFRRVSGSATVTATNRNLMIMRIA